jgi:hypothetical protein
MKPAFTVARANRLFASLLLLTIASVSFAEETKVLDIVIADFEGEDYGDWIVEGDAFGSGPARGTLKDQQEVSGYRGNGLVNTFRGGDASVGTAISDDITIERSHIALLIGGGPHKETVGVELLVDGKPIRRATGRESEELEWTSWDVTEFAGRKARLRIFDPASGGWGHTVGDRSIQRRQVRQSHGHNFAPTQFDLAKVNLVSEH